MRKPLLLAAVLVLLTTACRAEANIIVNVADDGSGEVTVELGMDDELQELLEGFGGGTEELFSLAPEDENVETRTEGDMTYFFATETFDDPDDLLSTAGVLEEAEATFSGLDLEVVDGAATLDATIETPSADEALEGFGGFEIGEDVFSSSLIVDLPGSVVEHNADEVLSDGRLKWDIPLLGGTVDVHAVTEAGGGGAPWGLILGILGAIVLIGGAIWLSQRRSASPVSAIESMDEPAAPAGVFEGTDQSSSSEAEGSEPEA